MIGCHGLCVTGADIGVGTADQVAYAHPMCPEHGEPHEFRWNGEVHDTHDGALRWCECGAYEDNHPAATLVAEVARLRAAAVVRVGEEP